MEAAERIAAPPAAARAAPLLSLIHIYWQEKPAAGLARRTSPTNIGLALLSVMAAVDLDLLPQDQGAGLIRHVLNTVEGLEKWRGHLYNWYDTVSARPMACLLYTSRCV